jgi:hypothetical protein
MEASDKRNYQRHLFEAIDRGTCYRQVIEAIVIGINRCILRSNLQINWYVRFVEKNRQRQLIYRHV